MITQPNHGNFFSGLCGGGLGSGWRPGPIVEKPQEATWLVVYGASSEAFTNEREAKQEYSRVSVQMGGCKLYKQVLPSE